MNCADLGETLKRLRKNQNLTQKELGLRVGLSKAVVSKYENGLGYPNYDTLIRLAQQFGVTTDYLLGVSSGLTVDVSGLVQSQIDVIHQLIAEFRSSNS